ncbi:MAG: DUF2812 domain-containing protein [Bacillota bacterium]|nr:DUF2812 domain-containing protein [Bacillota bacterium]
MIKLFPITNSLPQNYEKWLENYELKGWNLKAILLGGWIHYFAKEESRKIRYCYDYHGKKKKDYETIFIDAGWELVNYSLGAYTWRIKYDKERPEAFSDNISIIGRNNRLLALILVCLIPYLITIILAAKVYIEGKSLGFVGPLIIIATFLLYVSLIGGLINSNRKNRKTIKM